MYCAQSYHRLLGEDGYPDVHVMHDEQRKKSTTTYVAVGILLMYLSSVVLCTKYKSPVKLLFYCVSCTVYLSTICCGSGLTQYVVLYLHLYVVRSSTLTYCGALSAL